MSAGCHWDSLQRRRGRAVESAVTIWSTDQRINIVCTGMGPEVGSSVAQP